MNGRPTDHRNLDLCQLNLDVAFGRAGGKVIWQPRILSYFSDRKYAGLDLPVEYRGMEPGDVYRKLECSNRNYFFNAAFEAVYDGKIEFENEVIDDATTKYSIRTPIGEIYRVVRRSIHASYPKTVKWLVETPEDMKVLTWVNDHCDWKYNSGVYAQLSDKWCDLGAPTLFMPRVSVQNLYLDVMGVENAVYAMQDWDEVEDYFKVLHENQMRYADAIIKSPIQIINYGDNVHSSMLTPRMYEKHVLPCYLARGEKFHAAGRWVNAHWDGHVRPLLKYARISGLDGIEAITPQPQGDVSLEEMKAALGDEVFLLDGIPAVYFDDYYSEEVLVECVEKLIKMFAPKLILGISDEMSATGDIERIKIVGKMVDDYNASLAKE